MDRGVPTEEVLAEMRAADPPVHYLVGTPKGRLTRLEKHLVAKPWQEARPGVQVKLLAQEGELYEQDLIPVRSFLTPRRPTGWTRSRSASMPIPHGRYGSPTGRQGLLRVGTSIQRHTQRSKWKANRQSG
jgi:hypothetical protein